MERKMSNQTPSSPKTPHHKRLTWKQDVSPSFIDSPACSSTPSTNKKENGSFPNRKVLWEKKSPSKHTKLLGSPISKQSVQSQESKTFNSFQSTSKESVTEPSSSISKLGNSTDPSWSKTFSSAESAGTVTVELDFPHGGWDEDSSNEDSSCSLEIVESEVECIVSPAQRGRKRKQSEVSVEDNAILNGMGEEIERQLEAKAERNRLTVPNVKNILRSVITNPYVQAMVRRSIKSGDVAVSGDCDDLSFEPRLTRAKARLLCDSHDANVSDVSWVGTPHKVPQPSECQALINEELCYDSDDDEEYQPGEDEPSDNDYSERDGSERGSERDISLEHQLSACCDTDNESLSATPTPSPKPHIIDSATQTNWSEDGVFKVPVVPPEPPLDHITEENIALRTRSKLPLNDTPLEEIEQAFIPPDITPDLYDTTCDNADWQEFLKEFMQPMRSEVPNHDDDDEDPEYNVLADEEIIDKEELRMDRAVKISKRELNELMRELLEFTENLSSDDEDKDAEKKRETQGATLNVTSASPGSSNNVNGMGSNEDMSFFFEQCMSLGTLTPLNQLKTTPPPSRSPNTPTLHTPVPPMSPPCRRTPGSGKKALPSDVNFSADVNIASNSNGGLLAIGKGKSPSSSSGKKKSMFAAPGKADSYLNSSACVGRSGKKEKMSITPGKLDSYPEAAGGGKTEGPSGKLDSYATTSGECQSGTPQHRGKLDSYPSTGCDNQCDISAGLLFNEVCDPDPETIGLIAVNTAEPVVINNENGNHFSSPGKNFFLMTSATDWDKSDGTVASSCHRTVMEFQNTDDRNWAHCNDRIEMCEPSSAQAGEAEQQVMCEPSSAQEDDDPELSVSLALSNSPPTPVEPPPELAFSERLQLSSNGDVVTDNTVILSVAQQLVLHQQMRQHVQLLTQHFMQTCQHPILGDYAEVCKKHLVALDSFAGNRTNSAFRPANLSPALELVNDWEDELSLDEGPEILEFMSKEVATAKQQRNRKNRYVEKFNPQFMNAIVNSKAIVYPELLPHIPFRTIQLRKVIFFPSEEQLMVIGMEEFVDFIKEHDSKSKCPISRVLPYVTEYLLVDRCPEKLYMHIRKMRKTSEPISYYFTHHRAPKTRHVVKPFDEQNMTTLRDKLLTILPALPLIWREYLCSTVPSAQE